MATDHRRGGRKIEENAATEFSVSSSQREPFEDTRSSLRLVEANDGLLGGASRQSDNRLFRPVLSSERYRLAAKVNRFGDLILTRRHEDGPATVGVGRDPRMLEALRKAYEDGVAKVSRRGS